MNDAHLTRHAGDDERFAAWFRDHAATLSTLDPDGPLDDLEPLREIVGGARVLAVGENAHFVREFSLARRRVLRFLAERCGFTTFAFEFGFSEAFALDPWLQGAGPDEDLSRISPTAARWGADELMHWLRRHNRGSAHPLRFVGVDLPEAGGSLRPALDPVADHLAAVDPEALPVLDGVLAIADRMAGGSGAGAGPAWATLDVAEQDAMTAGLARLTTRLRALEPLFVERGSRRDHDIAVRRVEAASRTDYMWRTMASMAAGTLLPADLSVREHFMAESVAWHLRRLGPHDRIVLAAHNNHIMKTELDFGGGISVLPMGLHLAGMLGDDYRAIAVVHTTDHVPEMYPDPEADVGFTVADAKLGEPSPGSVEAGLVAAGLGEQATVTTLAGAPDLSLVRSQSTELSIAIPDAFDGLLSSPTVTVDGSIDF